MDGMPKSSEVKRQVPKQEGRVPVSRRSSEEQQAWHEEMKRRQEQAKQETVVDEPHLSYDEIMENRRQALVEKGGVFDKQGSVTSEGRRFLQGHGWDDLQIEELQNLQRNRVAQVKTIPEEPIWTRSVRESAESQQKLAEARKRMAEEFSRRESDQGRFSEGERRMEGIRAFNETYQRTGSEAEALRAQERAGREYDLKKTSKRAA